DLTSRLGVYGSSVNGVSSAATRGTRTSAAITTETTIREFMGRLLGRRTHRNIRTLGVRSLSAFVLSGPPGQNCSDSVDSLSAIVEAVPPEMTCGPSSK